MIPAHQLVEYIASTSNGVNELKVYWLTLSGDRDEYAERIRKEERNFNIVPWVVRSQGLFGDPNSIMNDITQILEEARGDIEKLNKSNRSLREVHIILINRKNLEIAVTSSPITLPYWFPVGGGQTGTAQIKDLTWSLTVPISDEAVEIGDLQRLLYDLDSLMVERIAINFKDNRSSVQALLDHIKAEESKPAATIENFRSNLQEIENPAKYRPSGKNPTITSSLWRLANSKTSDQQIRIAKALNRALSIDEVRENIHIPLVAALSRPANRITDQRDLWALALLQSIRFSCQFVTAAAHADEYPSYPITLLKSFSVDLRSNLNSAIEILEASYNQGS